MVNTRHTGHVGPFPPRYIATIGVDYGVKPHTINDKSLRVNFWDLSGHDAFFDVRSEFYKDTQALVLVFDVTKAESFKALDGWLKEARKFGCSRECSGALCANKCDLPRRAVTEEEGRSWAKANNFTYFETSASSGANVVEVFEHTFAEALRR
jgi:DnaJ family protein C protein 27